MYYVAKEYEGKEISLFVKGLPSMLILSAKISQKVLKQLHELGINGIDYKERNSSTSV